MLKINEHGITRRSVAKGAIDPKKGNRHSMGAPEGKANGDSIKYTELLKIEKFVRKHEGRTRKNQPDPRTEYTTRDYDNQHDIL
jgi:hypothetical protein